MEQHLYMDFVPVHSNPIWIPNSHRQALALSRVVLLLLRGHRFFSLGRVRAARVLYSHLGFITIPLQLPLLHCLICGTCHIMAVKINQTAPMAVTIAVTAIAVEWSFFRVACQLPR